tara:strand:- start:511 stop:1251 length:741 start_codon:yes stop_codon:yes gene_type:complete
MALPSTRETFKQYCLRQLGKPVIDINVSDDQCEDRIDDALQYYRDYHFDGTEKVYLKKTLTADDITNMYLDLDASIIGVVNMFDIGDSVNTNNIFNLKYQISLNDIFDASDVTMLGFYQAFAHIALLEELLVGQQPLRFNRHKNRVHVDMNWDKVIAGEILIFEAYQVVDPAANADVWADRWLIRYTTELFKKQWGSNLSKFEGMQLPGGVTFNGVKIYDDAITELNKLEEEMITSYSLPVHDLTG